MAGMSSHRITTSAQLVRLPATFRRPAPIDLMPEGRREILLELCRNPGASAAEVGEALFLSPGAVRLHLRALLAEGLVEYVTHPGAVGRPRHIYRLTRLGRSLFASASEAILITVLDRLQEKDPEGYGQLMQEIEQAYAATPYEDPASVPVEERARALQQRATEFGHECHAEVAEGDVPEWRVYNCAIFEVARKNPAICQAERRWLEGLFPESSIELDTWLVAGDLFCRFVGAPRENEDRTTGTITPLRGGQHGVPDSPNHRG